MKAPGWTGSFSALLLLTSTQSERLKDKNQMSEETFWQEQTQRGKGSIWFVLRPDGTEATLAQLQKPLLFSKDFSKDLRSAKDTANTHTRPPGRSCQLYFPAFWVRVVHLQPPSLPAFRGPEEHRMLLGWKRPSGSADFHLVMWPKRFSSASQFAVRQTAAQTLHAFCISKPVCGGLLLGDGDGCSCCGANKGGPGFLPGGEQSPSSEVLIG